MMAPRTFIGTLSNAPILRSRWPRHALFAVLFAILLLLSFFPERYRAAATLTPSDPASLGLSGALGQLGAINSVFGNQAAVEIALKVGRSIQVRDLVADRLKLKRRLGFESDVAMHRWLEREMTVRSLRGGIVQFETLHKDPDLAKDLVGAYASATQEQLAKINRRQTEYKRDVLLNLVTEASNRLARAQGAYDSFRLQTRYADPELAMEAIGSRIPVLQAGIKAKEVQLAAARQFATDDNMTVRQIVAELNALRAQLIQAQATNPAQSNSVGRVVAASTKAEKLERELMIAQSLYDGYMRFLEGTSVEDLTSTASVRVLEPPFVDTQRQIYWPALALALAVLLVWMSIEFYRLRPAVGDRLIVREAHG